MQHQIRIEVVQDLNLLAEHAQAWDQLAVEAPQHLPMLSYAWVVSYLEHQVEAGNKWWCLFAYDGEDLVGVLPIIIAQGSRFGFEWQSLRAPRDTHTRSGDLLVAPVPRSVVMTSFISEIESRIGARFSLKLCGVRESSFTLSLQSCDIPKAVVLRQPDQSGSFIRVTGSLADFHARLSDNFRGNLRKAQNKLAKLPKVTFDVLARDSARADLLEEFLKLEDSGWKGQEGTSIISSPSLVQFYDALVRRLSQRGWLEWHFLRVSGQPIAAQLAIKFGRCLVILKIAYDESFSPCAPGNMLFEHVVERAFASGEVDEINCLTDMPWHRNWRMERSSYYDVSIVPFRLLPLAVEILPLWIRTSLRRIPRLRPLGRILPGSSQYQTGE